MVYRGKAVFPEVDQADFEKILNLVHAMLTPAPTVTTVFDKIEQEKSRLSRK